MTSYAYHAGRWAAFDRLGLSKLAAIGAKTILPKALKSLEGAAPSALRGGEHAALQSSLSSPVTTSTLAESPWHQYMAMSRPAEGAAESATSKAFRGELAGQMKPGAVAPVAEEALATSLGHGPTLPPKSVAQSFAPTIPPPSRMPSMMPTVPPPGRVPK